MRFLILVLTAFLAIFTPAVASDYRAGQSVTVSMGDTLPDDLYAGARSVYIDGIVIGDVYAGAQNVRISKDGRVGDDVLAGCEEVQVYGPVGGNVIGFAGRIFIESEVMGDVLAYGGEVYLGKNALVHGNIYVGAGKIEIDGARIMGDLTGGAGRASLNGMVEGKVDLGLGTVSFGENYLAKGGTKLVLQEETTIDEIEYAPADLELSFAEKSYFFTSMFFIWGVVSLLITGILFVAVFKETARDMISFAQNNIFKASGMGFVFLIVIPVAVVILVVLIFTIPVALIGGTLYLILFYLAHIVSALILGDLMLRQIDSGFRNGRLFIPLIVGIIFVVFLPEIPYIGWLIDIAFVSLGLGTFILYGWQNLKPVKAA